MKKLLFTLVFVIAAVSAALSQPGTRLTMTYIGQRSNDTAAGTCDSSKKFFVYANTTTNKYRVCDGTAWADLGGSAGAGSGTVTNNGGNLTANALILGAGSADTKVSTGLTSDGTAKLILGLSTTSVGSIDFKNLTSGTINLAPATGALGTSNLVLPATSGTLVTGLTGATSTAILRANGTGGSTLQNSLATIDGSGNITVPANTGLFSGTVPLIATSGANTTLGGAGSGTFVFYSPNADFRFLDYPGGSIQAQISSNGVSLGASTDAGIKRNAASEAQITNGSTGIGDLSLGNVKLQDDTNPSHFLSITDAEDLTGNHTLSLNSNNADRTISLSGNLTVSSAATVSGTTSGTNTGDQTLGSLGAAASGANTDITSVLLNQTGLVVKGATANALTIKPNETLSSGRTLNVVTGDATRTLTFAGDATISGTTSGTNTGDQIIPGGNNCTNFNVSGSDATTTGQTLVDITGLVTGTLALNSNYIFKANLYVTTSAVTTGIDFGTNITVAPTRSAATYYGATTAASNLQTMGSSGTNANNIASAPFLTTASEEGVVIINGFFTTAGTGSPVFSLRHLKVTSGTSTVKIGSTLMVCKQ